MTTTNSPSDSSSQAARTDSIEQSVTPSDVAWRSGPLSGLICGLLATVATWLVLEICLPLFGISESAIADLQVVPDAWVQQELFRRTLFSLGVLGACLGLVLGIGEGIRRSRAAIAMGGILGGLFGAGFGVLAAWGGLQAFERLGGRPDLMPIIMTTGAVLGIVTGGVGLGLGIVFGRSFRMAVICTIAGLLSGVVAGICYTTLLSFCFPDAVTDVVLPVRWMDRAIWIAMTAVSLGVILTGIARNPSRR